MVWINELEWLLGLHAYDNPLYLMGYSFDGEKTTEVYLVPLQNTENYYISPLIVHPRGAKF
jgi:hypothetical protein